MPVSQQIGIQPIECWRRELSELAASFQTAVVDVIVVKLLKMAKQYRAKGLILGGGVTANAMLRREISARSPLPVIMPPPILCTDNGAMIACCAYYRYRRGEEFGMDLDIDPALPLG